MKTPRCVIIILTLLTVVFTALSTKCPATEYAGGFVEWTDIGMWTYEINVPAAGEVTNVGIFINNAQTFRGFENNAMLLTSPNGTTTYLFDLVTCQISGKSLFLTRFDDNAPIIISEGISPYAGSFRPGQSFSNFLGEWMTGTWTLAVYNNANGNNGAITDWSLILNQATPIPTSTPVVPTPTPIPITYREYSGSSISWSSVGTTTGIIGIGNQGIVHDVNVNLSATVSGGLVPIGVYLQSPAGDSVALFNQNDLENYSLYLTTFDDAADQSIKNGIAPYIGLYRPVESLALFNDQSLKGDWSLIVYSNSADSGEISDWSLIIGAGDYIATPTPVSTPPPTPTPEDYHAWEFPIIPPAPSEQWAGVQVTQIDAYVDEDFLVEDVDILVSAWCQGDCDPGCDLDTKALYLTSPNNTIVKLFGKHTLEEKGLYLTYFDDEASQPITSDIAPYYGPHQPVGDLFAFDGEWSLGTWTLSWYNDEALDFGEISYCKLYINIPEPTATATPSPTPTSALTPTPDTSPTLTPYGYHTPTPSPPPTPFPTCAQYDGSFFSWTGVEVVESEIVIPVSGKVAEVRLHIQELYCDGDLDSVGMYILSPDNTIVDLFEKHTLEEHQMYLTTFQDDADLKINADGVVAPYIGPFQPMGKLRNFQGEWVAGTWTLVVYNDGSSNDGWVEDWSLLLCYSAQGTPTPTPQPTMTNPPTPPPAAPVIILQSGDYAGDGRSGIGIFRPATGLWSVRSVGTSFFGQAGDIPANGDYNGDGSADLAIFRGSTGLWAISGVTRAYFGGSSDTTVPGDYDGDGFCDIGIYRSSAGLWAIRGVTRLYFGNSGDYPVPEDYDGDGFCDFAVFRPLSGLWAVHGLTRVYYGTPADLPVPRDYDGDWSADIGIMRLSNGLWAIRDVSRFYFGTSGDYPVPADYEGNGTAYPGIFRGSSGLWAIKEFTRVYHGAAGDIPVAR